MEPGERLVTVLVTLSVPATADADDAATLIAVAADSTALTVVHTTGVEGHLPLPGSTVLRGRQERPWLVHSLSVDTAILTDLAGGVVQVALTALHPDRVDSPTDPTCPGPPTPLTSARSASPPQTTTHPAVPTSGEARLPRQHRGHRSPRPPLS